MKTILPLILLASLAAGRLFAVQEPVAPAPASTGSTPVPAVVAEPSAPGTDAAAVTTNAVTVVTNGEAGLRLNFRGASLDQVLNYLSEAAGFIIVLDTKVSGKIDVWSNTPLTRDEAVNLLNSVLNKNGYAAIRNGRTLTVVNKDEAKTKNIPVKQGSDPAGIPTNDEIVTQIIPVRFVEVAQLIKDLQPLVSTTTTMTANEAGNAMVITDTQANIHRVAEIIQAIDQGAEDVTEVEVFRLEYADPTEMATLLTSVFPDETRSGTSQSPVQFGGPGGFGRFFGGGGRNAGGTASTTTAGQSARIKKRARVIAVPDARTQSVIVSAASGLMQQIRGMVTQLDSNPAKKQKVYVYSLENADAQQVESVLQEMFETTTTRNNSRNSQNQNNVLQNRANQSQQSTTTTSGTGTRTGRGTGTQGGGF